MNDEGNDPKDDLIDFGPQLRKYLNGDVRALVTLPTRERGFAEELAKYLKAEQEMLGSNAMPSTTPDTIAPPLHQDPIAIALGLVAGPHDWLDSSRFKAVRTQSALDIKAVAERLAERGWPIDVAQVFRWQKANTEISPALLTALAEVLGTTSDSLRADSHSTVSMFDDLLSDDAIAAFINEWAQETGRTTIDVRANARRTLASLNYRNEGAAARHDVLAVLRALRKIDPRRPE